MTRSFVAIATAIALCPSVAMAQPVASAPPAAAAAPAPAPVAAEPAPAPAAPATATAGPATVTATPAAPQAQAQPPATVNAPTNVAVTVNTSQAQAQSQEQPQPAPPVAAPTAEPTPTPPPPVVVQQTYAPGVEDHPVYGPRYRAASGVMFTGVGFLIAGPALLLTVTLPAYALQKNAVDNSHDASTLAWEERYLDRAYRRNMAMQVSGVTALVFTAVGLAMTVGGGVGRARARRAAERDYERRARVEPGAGGVVVRF